MECVGHKNDCKSFYLLSEEFNCHVTRRYHRHRFFSVYQENTPKTIYFFISFPQRIHIVIFGTLGTFKKSNFKNYNLHRNFKRDLEIISYLEELDFPLIRS